jgi:hypothetical protein
MLAIGRIFTSPVRLRAVQPPVCWRCYCRFHFGVARDPHVGHRIDSHGSGEPSTCGSQHSRQTVLAPRARFEATVPRAPQATLVSRPVSHRTSSSELANSLELMRSASRARNTGAAGVQAEVGTSPVESTADRRRAAHRASGNASAQSPSRRSRGHHGCAALRGAWLYGCCPDRRGTSSRRAPVV